MAAAALGVYFGEPSDLIAPDGSNQEGYWEHKPLLRINRAILGSMNVPQFDIDFMPENWAESPPSRALLADYEATIKKHFAGRGLWGYKDPETTLVLPLVKKALSNLGLKGRYVLCARNPIEVADSELKRIRHDRMLSLGSWMQHVLFGLVQSMGESRTVIVFDHYLENPRKSLEALVALEPEWKPSEVQWTAAFGSCRKDLVHARSSRDELAELPALIGQTYDLLLEASEDPNAYQRGDFDSRILAIDREYRIWLAMLRLQDPPRGSFRVEWLERQTPKFVKAPFDAKRGWVPISIEFSAPPESDLRISLYQSPGTVWIRNPGIVHGSGRSNLSVSGGQHGQLIDDQGIPWLWPRYGVDQIRARCPKDAGPYRLEMDVFVSTGILATNRMWQGMSEQIDQLMARGVAPRPPFR